MREEAASLQAQCTGVSPTRVQCTRCEHRGVECVQVSMSMSRYYPRPSRTGRRIELGRQLHGSAIYPDPSDEADDEHKDSSDDTAQRELSWPRIYLRMIKVFFSYTHTHFPLLSYERFSRAFNASYGDLKVMAQLINQKDKAADDRPFHYLTPQHVPLLRGNAEDECTPETLEVLIAVILAAAARHVHLPFESLDPAIFANMGTTSLVDAILADPELGCKRKQPPADVRHGTHATDSPVGGAEGVKRRVKRRQGVACDTCRLRRVRCDLMEQPPGSKACSRCRVKRIVCTDRYIQWKQQRDLQKHATGQAGNVRTVPVAVSCVQLLPELHEFEFDEMLSPSTLNLSQQELLECGMVRENVCNLLLNRALLLVHKYNLQHTCNMQSAVCLLLLATLLDYARPEMAFNAQTAGVRHLQVLQPYVHIEFTGIEQPSVAHERLCDLFASRVQLCAWVHDAVLNVSYQRRPQFAYNWFLVGEQCLSAPDGASSLRVHELDKYVRDDLPEKTAMLLVFSSTTYLGRIAHRMYRDLIEPLAKQTSLPSEVEVRHISDVVYSLWDDLFVVERTHQFLARRARNELRELRAISIVHWSTMVYSLMFILYQAVTRCLRDWFITNNSQLSRGSATEEARTRVLDAIRGLFQESQERMLCMCRAFAYLARRQLTTGLLHRATSLTRQLFRAAQFLARSQPIESNARSGDAAVPVPVRRAAPAEQAAARVDFLLNPAQAPGSDATPRRSAAMPAPSEDAVHAARESIFNPELCVSIPTTRTLPPFTRERKRDEIGGCIEALGQIGYAR
ncbi:hypothetical protein MBRA1_002081 [Malassezia brasiliensis]|uniref:Zn(2)-C6 fungal-type domain-containing protein n=1 Tax=Malassezia brasiliensis TaxID=1821822 RepID=A0AAF0ISZ0_9BASI|nr:hypothetical protein MBRA1_002081 [Malassezia brasiliensis]